MSGETVQFEGTEQLPLAQLSEHLLNRPVERGGPVYNQICILQRRTDELRSHRPHGGRIMLSNRFRRPSSLVYIARKTALIANLVRSIYIYAQMIEPPQCRIVQRKNSIYQQKMRLVQQYSLSGNAGVSSKIILRLMNAAARSKPADVRDQQV